MVIVGGAQGFGLAAARFLARHGARHLALLGRRGAATPGAAAALRELTALGARAAIHACDAADASALAGTLSAIRATGRPITGVVHAAAVMEDGAAASMDAARFRKVLAPKLLAAENLDRLTATDPLELFLMFSSATVAFGNPGQSAYVAANAALEALARRRRAAGRPALAVAWGPIEDAGMLAGDARTTAHLQRRLGAEPMGAEECLSVLPAMLAAGHAAPILVRLGRGEGRLRLPIMAEPMLTALAVEGGATEEPAGDLRARLVSLPRAEAEMLLVRLVSEEIARILRLPAEAVAPAAPVVGLGLDSLGAMELRTSLEGRLGIGVPLGSVTEELTVARLAARIAEAALAPQQDEAVAALVESFEPAPGSVAPGSVAAE
jgi:NAD(P)-dependent dehydrogenase (short-subunit alcohol dehydrogenase family)/acyl carrier protein